MKMTFVEGIKLGFGFYCGWQLAHLILFLIVKLLAPEMIPS